MAPNTSPSAPEVAGCCPFQEAIDLLSRRHAMTIIWLLQQESPRRFNDMRRAMEVNPVSLTQRLTELEEGGIVLRQAYKETPPRVEYSLTQKGRDLLPLMDQLSAWSFKHQGTGIETAAVEAPVAQPATKRRKESTKTALVVASTGKKADRT